MYLSGMSARCFMALMTRLDAACMQGELLPVTHVAVGQLDGRAAKDALVALLRSAASGAAWRASGNHLAVIRFDVELIHEQLNPLGRLLVHESHDILAVVPEEPVG